MYETHDNEVIVLLLTSTALLLLLAITLGVFVLFQQKRKHRHQRQLDDMQRTLLKSELKIQEETFRAISQNLHDNIGSTISTAMLLLYRDDQTGEEEGETNRKEALNMLDRVVDDLKDISRSLNAGYLEDIGLSEAIRHRINQLKRSKKYDIELICSDTPRRIDRQKQVLLFYIFQEAMTNINKHAEAKRIAVNLHYGKNELIMQISDDGKGIEERDQKGSGLINMKDHAAMINANLSIDTDKEKGTRIVVTVPAPYPEVPNIG